MHTTEYQYVDLDATFGTKLVIHGQNFAICWHFAVLAERVIIDYVVWTALSWRR